MNGKHLVARAGRLVTAAAVVAAVVVAGGCAGRAGVAGDTSPGDAAGGPATASGPATTGGGATSAGPTGPSTGAGAGVPNLPECRKAVLSVSIGPESVAAGHRGSRIVFTNKGHTSCVLIGYPGVAALDAKGNQVMQAKRTMAGHLGGVYSGHVPTVELNPGESASTVLESLGSAGGGGSCPTFEGVLVTAPDDTESTRLAWHSDGCVDLQIHPVVPGTEGRTNN